MTGEKYRPGSAADGLAFVHQWCTPCRFDTKPCQLVGLSLAHRVTEPEYPAELTFNDAGRPICTAFQQAGA